MSATLRQSITKRAALTAIAQLENIRKEPEELAALLVAERTELVRKYLKHFDKATDRLISTFLQYVDATERRR